ncbi:amino acid permease [Sporolactobacillus sp. CQH2019]|uniref:APC family permease n=1 Tax=Sporolactobacillus sp. CQH2019 TaxID=3023512 RepID=UPI0023679FF2|nr:amino acid permease [Sporolactobacillus sp. CQH2019]MDD9148535.1 amino acid permease [Sporolactobacillus sp. CQH2019]
MKKEIKATIRLPQAVALYIGAVLGSGILIVPGLAARMAGPASLIDWGFLMVLALPLSVSMAYLAQEYPSSGGVAHFVRLAFGERAGSIVGWFFLMSVPIGAPVAALTGSGYLSAALGQTETFTIFIACLILFAAVALNYLGMSLAGKIQIAVVAGILGILIAAILGAVPHMKVVNFEPFMPHGAAAVGSASTILFWCFIGWEAVSHLSAEFVRPERDVMRATILSAGLVGTIYFMTAAAVIGTDSYRQQSQAALVAVARLAFGQTGGVLIGLSGLLICLATVVAYIGAASRLGRALSETGSAPGWLGLISKKYGTPLGGLLFLSLCFIFVMIFFGLKIVTLTDLIQLPNAAFLLTYFGGCAAGVVLFRNERKKRLISLTAAAATFIMIFFIGRALVYPAIILAVMLIFRLVPGAIARFMRRIG